MLLFQDLDFDPAIIVALNSNFALFLIDLDSTYTIYTTNSLSKILCFQFYYPLNLGLYVNCIFNPSFNLNL